MSFFLHHLPWPVLHGTTQDYKKLLQIPISRDVTATPSWHVPKELTSWAHCKGRQEWDFSWKPSQSFQARCRTLCCSQPDKWYGRSNKADYPWSTSILFNISKLCSSWAEVFRRLFRMQNPMMMSDSEHFSSLSLAHFLTSERYVQINKEINWYPVGMSLWKLWTHKKGTWQK